MGAVGGFASGPASGPVRLEHWQILIFWSFWIKPKGRRKKTDEGFSDGLIKNITNPGIYRPCLRHFGNLSQNPYSSHYGSTPLTNHGWLGNRPCLRHFPKPILCKNNLSQIVSKLFLSRIPYPIEDHQFGRIVPPKGEINRTKLIARWKTHSAPAAGPSDVKINTRPLSL